MTRASSVLALLIGAILPALAEADDGAIHSVGGAVSAMQRHPTIHLTAEFVHATFTESGVKVECVFFLENRGPATTVTMGFPNRSGGADVERIFPFANFVSYVDGEPVPTVIQADSLRHSYGDYACWYTKDVAFGQDQIRCVRDIYTAYPGSTAPRGSWFDYILWSGSSWAGPIHVADVVFTFDSPAVMPDSTDITPSGWQRSDNELRWHFNDIDPELGSKNDVIHVAWD